MKKTGLKYGVLIGLVCAAQGLMAQHLQVDGHMLEDANGNPIVLRGINYPVIDDYNVRLDHAAEVEQKIDQLAMTGANCVRFPWYTNGTHYKDQLDPNAHPDYGPGTLDGYVNNGGLSHLLAYTRNKGMIPILEIHDFTGGNDHVAFQNEVMGFWTDPDVLNLIATHSEYLVINLANEYGLVRFTNNQQTASNAFRDNYITAITALRNAGVTVPILIDAPDYGQSSTELLTVAPAILNSDPLGNIMFSAHAYWAGYANNATDVQTKLDEIQVAGYCFILGEVANSQADAPDYCGELDLSQLYPVILNNACERQIGWLAWCYDQDCDPDRELTTDGNFANLTAYGNDIVYNTTYGLLSDGGCGAVSLVDSVNAVTENSQVVIAVYPNPAGTHFYVSGTDGQPVQLIVRNALGELVFSGEVMQGQSISCAAWKPGVYMLWSTSPHGMWTSRFTKL